MASVVVTDTLDWKLHGFDLLSDFSSVEYSPLRDYSFLVGDQYKCAEVAKGEWSQIPQQPPWAVDAWGLGCFMQEVFSGKQMISVDQLREINHIPEALVKDYQKLLTTQPGKRLNPSRVAKSKFLNNQLVSVVNFLENLAVKESVEKDTFFRKLSSVLPSLPGPVAQRKILPMLASALEFGGAPAVGLTSILQIGEGMDETEFAERVIPCISKLFASNDRSIRRGLLENIDKFAAHLSQTLVETEVYPNLQSGFTDSNAYIRELTLKSMRDLAPQMTQKTLNQSLLKFLAKLQVDQEPAIRANTTVLLGTIADLLGETACKRVLLNAFGRAVRDQFPHARIAGLKALQTTKKYHSAEDVAQRVIPMVAPLTIDSLKEAREAALSCLNTYVSVLKDNSKRMDSEAVPSSAASNPQSTTSKSSEASGYLGWAVSSFGLGAKAGSGHSGVASHPVPSVPSSAVQNQDLDPPERLSKPSLVSISNDFDDQDGWDTDELEGFEEDREEVEARKRLTQPSAARRHQPSKSNQDEPRVQSHSRVHSKSSDGWNDESDDIWEEMGMKAPDLTVNKTNPKPVSKVTGRPSGTRVSARKPMKLGAQKLKKDDFEF